MIVENGLTYLSVNEQIEQIRDILDSARVIGVVIGAVMMQDNSVDTSQTAVLCLYLDCYGGKFKSESGLPVFPMFFSHHVCDELGRRGLTTVIDMSYNNDVARWWMKFNETWVMP